MRITLEGSFEEIQLVCRLLTQSSAKTATETATEINSMQHLVGIARPEIQRFGDF